jgi:hypothetical protein
MLTELPSDDTRAQPSSAKRIRIEDPPSTEVSDKAIPPTRGKTPLEAAMAAATTYVETLHNKLQPFLRDLIRQVLKDASTFHHKYEKLQEMRANPDYVPAVCCTVGMKLQAVSEVSKSTGFKTLEDELEGEIQALRRDWATRFVLPVQDLNVCAMRKRFQLSFCRLLSKAAKVFIALEGAEGYNDNVAVMDLFAMHGNEVAAPLKVTPHDLLVLFKEAVGLTTIPFPTVEHSLTEIIDKVNGTVPAEAARQRDLNSLAPMATQATAAAAANTLANELTTAEATVTQATAQKDLARAISLQAQTIAEEAARSREQARLGLEETRVMRATVIDPIEIAQADEQVEIAEVTLCELDRVATEKGHIAYGANAFNDRACYEYEEAMKTLTNLRERIARNNDNGTPSDGASMSSCGSSTTTPRTTTSTLSSVSTNAGIITQTPGTILPGNPYVRASSLLHRETAAAIWEINAPTNSTDDTPMDNMIDMTTPSIGGRRNVITALKTLLDRGIVEPIRQFHTCLTSNEQERRISKATVEPALEQAAARIAAVVEAERPTNRPTLKGLIHEDVDKTTEELRRRIQSLESKLVVSSAKNELGGGKMKAMNPKGTATAQTKKSKPMNQKPKSKKKAPIPRKSKNKPSSPADNSNASTPAAKNPKEKKSRIKSSGNGRGKKTAARK